MKYLKENHLALLIILLIAVLHLFSGGDAVVGARDATTVTNPTTFEDPVTIEEGITVSIGQLTVSGGTTTANGLTENADSQSTLHQSTSTPCVLTSPNATSTLDSASFQMTTATDTDILTGFYRVAVQVHATGSGTQIGTDFVLGNNATDIDDFLHSVQASTSDGAAAQAYVFSPNENLVVGVSAKNVDANDLDFDLTGSCTALWRQF